MIKVRVPATSANLGVGYDCLGLALQEFATITFEEIAQGVKITGCDDAYANEDNLVYQAFCKGLNYLNKQVNGVHIHIDSPIPYARGLGSSAICIVAGLAGANALFHEPMNRYELFALATEMEGHPDNVAPAIFGGLCVSFMEDEKPNMIRFGVKRDMLFVAIIPDYEVSTKKAREVLPNNMSYKEAVYQMGRCTALAKAIEIGNGLIIKKACKDQMQEPYRKALIPDYDTVYKLCEQNEMYTMYISGSGSTMMALTQDMNNAESLAAAIHHSYPTWKVQILQSTYDGVHTEVE
ncbi:homoserine kinase [Erysipelotrichaceae bacterium HCN-30851]